MHANYCVTVLLTNKLFYSCYPDPYIFFQSCNSSALFFHGAGKAVKSFLLVCHTVVQLVDTLTLLRHSSSNPVNALLLFCCQLGVFILTFLCKSNPSVIRALYAHNIHWYELIEHNFRTVHVFIESDIDIRIKYTRDHGTLLHGVCGVYIVRFLYIYRMCICLKYMIYTHTCGLCNKNTKQESSRHVYLCMMSLS